MIKYSFTEIKEFDDFKERERINSCFDGALRVKLHHILDAFLFEKYDYCIELVNKLGYNNEVECPEIEFVSTFIIDSLNFMLERGTIQKT